jgi:hypothetical protein
MLTTKQVSADLRKSLGILAEHGILRYSSGAEIHVPAGLDFTVRATRTGVNITIEDRGWRESASASEADDADGWREEAARIRAEVDKIRGLYTPSLPGKTEWVLPVIQDERGGVADGGRMRDRNGPARVPGGAIGVHGVGGMFSLVI